MKQTIFSDIEFNNKKRLTRRERFVAEIEAATLGNVHINEGINAEQTVRRA